MGVTQDFLTESGGEREKRQGGLPLGLKNLLAIIHTKDLTILEFTL